MRRTSLLIGHTTLVACVAMAATTFAWADDAGDALAELARMASSTDEAAAAPAIARLRQFGPDGLAALGLVYDGLVEEQKATVRGEALPTIAAQLARVSKAMDAVAAQRDSAASRLFWHTDLAEAIKVAEREHKPILSLRLLGKLTDEYSCANSRFFRTTLYANQAVSQRLREQFVLHWQSVRPVPRVTIDFGDGRRLERTLTGNSIHYVLDAAGRPIDALPGLYGPKAFLTGLAQAEAEASAVQLLHTPERVAHLRQYHAARQREILRAWENDLEQLATQQTLVAAVQSCGLVPEQSAAAASPRVASNAVELEARMNDALWEQVAALHRGEAELDATSIALVRKHRPNAAQAGRLAITKRIAEDPILRLVQNLQNSIAVDTVRNEYLMRRRIHEWFASSTVDDNLAALNARVYAELFLTPDTDPWLGLAPNGVYTGLENNGVSDATAASRR